MSTTTVSTQTAALVTAAQPVIQGHEGRELKVYLDTEHIPTIGVGFNLEDPDARQLCAACGADYDALLNGTAILTDAQCDWLYRQLAVDVIEWLTLLFPAFFTYSQSRQIALLDQGYTLGETRFRRFEKEIEAILESNWPEAAAQMLNSEWHEEDAARCASDAHLLVVG